MPTSASDEEACADLIAFVESSKLILKPSKLSEMLENVAAISRDASNNGCLL